MTDPTAPTSTDRASKREQAVTALFRDYHAPLIRLAFLFGADDPEGVVSEAFEALFRRWVGLRNTDADLAYLRKVVYNQTCGQFRRRQRERETVDRIERDPTTAPPVAQDDHHEVVDALNNLPTQQRAVLVLRVYDELSDSEIAKTLGISVGTVRTHAFRGKKSLKRILRTTLEKQK